MLQSNVFVYVYQKYECMLGVRDLFVCLHTYGVCVDVRILTFVCVCFRSNFAIITVVRCYFVQC